MNDIFNSEIHLVNAGEEWVNSAYDEHGDFACCEWCGCEMKWDSSAGNWYCPKCGNVLDRKDYLEYIGAVPPGEECLSTCKENYPFCKRYCPCYIIDPDDPIFL